MGGEVEFLPAYKYKSFLQDGSITLGVISQTDLKYQRQSVYNIFATSRGKNEIWSWFFTSWQMLKVFQIDTIILGVFGQACPNYLKQQVSYFSTAC